MRVCFCMLIFLIWTFVCINTAAAQSRRVNRTGVRTGVRARPSNCVGWHCNIWRSNRRRQSSRGSQSVQRSQRPSNLAQPIRAKCIFEGLISGTIIFEPSITNMVRVSGSVSGLRSNALNGFHVHEYGDLTNGCTSTGGHFNPFNRQHGAPQDTERHVGDLGNILVGLDGVADVNLLDMQISLVPGNTASIIGRAVVVHAGTDDLGRGLHSTSRTTGNAGVRLACCIIGVAGP